MSVTSQRTRRTRFRPRPLSLAVLLGIALAAGTASGQDEAQHYTECLAQAAADPAAALADARSWEEAGGGNPARHCAAAATAALGRPADAARMLEDLGLDLLAQEPVLGVQVLLEAGGTWLDAGAADQAVRVYSWLLEQMPDLPDALMARAFAHERAGDDAAALADLEQADEVAPGVFPDAGLLRAVLLRRLGRLDDALELLDALLARQADDPALLLERGSVRLRAGDGEGARADWQRVVEVAPDTDQAAAAAARLARLDGAGG
ncbi:MAG: tetratricopeptide repeat protein [Rhodospirillaceae bacterium]|nr:tetratricopeptide repeat protein [Rhodospirillaceae bacterium]MCA8933811.1 tetratricopeptide repeat protein [Rhodospirillaceae bacterium]